MLERDKLSEIHVVDALLAGDHPIKVYAKYGGLKQKELAAAVGIDPVYLSQIVSGKRNGSLDLRRNIAAALSLDLDDLES